MRERAKLLAEQHPPLEEILGRIADGDTVEGMEAFSPVLADRMELLTDLLPDGSALLVCEPERIRTRSVELVRTSQEFLEASWVNAAAGERRRSTWAPPRSARWRRSASTAPSWACRAGA